MPITATLSPSKTPIRTADEAAARALEVVRGSQPAVQPQVAQAEWMTLREAWAAMGSSPETGQGEPSVVVWWVTLMGSFRMSGGTGSSAVVVLAVSDGHVVSTLVGDQRAHATPTPASHQIPSGSLLQTPADAMAEGFWRVPGKGGSPATLANIRLLTVDEWYAEEAARGDYYSSPPVEAGPIWELEFVDTSLSMAGACPGGCPPLEHVWVAFDAATGSAFAISGLRGYTPPGTPAPTPWMSPTTTPNP